ncbi:MAG TPA: heme ABC exporter ATP-binding protein CcmA [Polyangia bacterium]|jgi:heme exporter protein A|nr:heme ABC exporter ATP-binding protein CcmA [Polyangia bacterium]
MNELVLEGVGKTYSGRRALRDVSTSFAPGQISAVLGPNGAGKTTLLGILSTLVAPTTGRLRWGDEILSRSSPARAAIGYVGHDPGVYGDLSARENLALFAALHGVAEPAARGIEMLARVGLEDAPADAPVRTFSRGMLQRLALARALVHAPSLLLFDEPSAALDPAGADWLQGELRAERAAGRIVVLVTHDLDAAGDVADHVMVLRRGRVTFDGTTAGGFSAAAVRDLYREHTRD